MLFSMRGELSLRCIVSSTDDKCRVTLVTDGPATLPLQVKEVAVNVPTS